MKIIFLLAKLFIFLHFIINNHVKNSNDYYMNIQTNVTRKNIEYYDFLFNTIEYDYYNLSLIYNNSYNTIKIKHLTHKKHSSNSIVCIFGILVNDKGIEIQKSMLKWLLPEYDVYCIYQKYPGCLYEYPALRFAQWFTIMFNISYILYVHTKGAFNQNTNHEEVRALWKHEFNKPRNIIYTQFLEKNIYDITLPFRSGICTWYNGMFISYRAFNSIDTIKYYYNNRFYYESLFRPSSKTSTNIRFKGILNDSIFSSSDVLFENNKFLRYFRIIANKKKSETIREFMIFVFLFIIIIFLKILNIIYN